MVWSHKFYGVITSLLCEFFLPNESTEFNATNFSLASICHVPDDVLYAAKLNETCCLAIHSALPHLHVSPLTFEAVKSPALEVDIYFLITTSIKDTIQIC